MKNFSRIKKGTKTNHVLRYVRRLQGDLQKERENWKLIDVCSQRECAWQNKKGPISY